MGTMPNGLEASGRRAADTSRPSGQTDFTASVLLVEDDLGFAEVVLRTLGKRGYVVTLTERGSDALTRLSSEEYDLVLLDLLLPDIDGESLLGRLLAVRPQQRVLVVSALSSVEAKVRCLDRGAADYLAKPFALDELVARVGAQVRTAVATPASRYLNNGSVTLDSKRRVAIASGRTVSLSTREFFLLEYLVRHKDDVCTRKDLLEHVWGFTFDPGTNVVDVYVRRLRKKLVECRIETVRNVGYCLVDS
jgi:DNA-binding response OmpR family regulator